MPWTADFKVDDDSTQQQQQQRQPRRVTLLDTSQGTDTAAACNASFRTLVQAAQDKGVFSKTLGRKAEGEDFRIMAARNYQGKRALVQLRRSAAPLFGIANRGAHMTVYTKSDEGKYRFWVPRRSRFCRTYPGMLDNTVAGGVKAEEVSLRPPFKPSFQILPFVIYLGYYERHMLLKSRDKDSVTKSARSTHFRDISQDTFSSFRPPGQFCDARY